MSEIYYSGSEIEAALKKNQKAICVLGLYRDYVISKWTYGGLLWENNELIETEDKFFIESKWKIILDQIDDPW
jgi:hypothetical protein